MLPEEMYRVTNVPSSALVPAAGSVRVTRSCSTLGLSSVRVADATLNPASSNICRASSCERLDTSGTSAESGPSEK